DAATLLDVVAVETDHERLGRRVAELLQGADDAVGDRVAGGDAAEDVDEHGGDLLVAEDDVEALGHHLAGGAAADVEDVRGLHAVLLARVGDHVEGGHDQARAVADDADLAVELDVVEVQGLGLGLERILGGDVDELGVALLAELRVVVEGDLAVEGDDLAVTGLDQRVDLDEGRVLLAVDVPQLHQHGSDLRTGLGVELRRGDDLLGLGLVDADAGVDGDAGEGLGALDGELLDLHAALDGAHGQVVAVRTVQQQREVVLLGDVRAGGDHDAVHGVALDVHAEDLGGLLLRLLGGL